MLLLARFACGNGAIPLQRRIVAPAQPAALAEALLHRHADQLERELDVLKRGQRREQVEELKHGADPMAAHPRQLIAG